jgi:hypothetical protein
MSLGITTWPLVDKVTVAVAVDIATSGKKKGKKVSMVR